MGRSAAAHPLRVKLYENLDGLENLNCEYVVQIVGALELAVQQKAEGRARNTHAVTTAKAERPLSSRALARSIVNSTSTG